jgi:oligoendopeptidase F
MNTLPVSAHDFLELRWEDIRPFYDQLAAIPLTDGNVAGWLAEWTRLTDLVQESYARLNVATTLETTDEEAETRLNTFQDTVYSNAQAAEQRLKQKLLDSGLEPAGMQNPLRKMRAEAAIFSTDNLPLLSADRKLGLQYNKIIGAQTLKWEGQEVTLQQLRPVFYQPDRPRREAAWRAAAKRQLQDREAINQLWVQQLEVRRQLADNAGLQDYRAYRWQQLLRLDYTPEDTEQFRDSIAKVAVPAATRIYEKHRQRAGFDRLRPWDLDQDIFPVERPSLPGYGSGEDLVRIAESIFQQVHPRLAEYFRILQREDMLDVVNRKGKAPGAYCMYYPVVQRPFIFGNAVGLFGDVRTMLHESGHAFHNFEIRALPYAQQRRPGLEFSEVASMSMELLSSPYWSEADGGFYSETDARRARVAHLEHILTFWPYMAVVDAFQHWVYTNLQAAADPAACDASWLELWQRFIPGVDWSDLDDSAATGWQRKQHIHRAPFYYVEYGLAQLGSVLVWRNARQDQTSAVESYLQALAMGGTATLPGLYQAAGAHFAFDAQTLGEAVEQIESVIEDLE